MRCRGRSRFPVVLVLVALATTVTPLAFADSSPARAATRIVLTDLASPPDDAVAQKLASTITSSLDLVMQMTGTLTVQRADFLTPQLSFDRARQYYRQAGADGAVFGSISPVPGGGYKIDIEVWNAAKAGEAPTQVVRTITNVLTSFDIADEISLEVASTVVGRKLSEGTLVVEGVGTLPSYSVYADGHLLGRDKNEFRLLTGERTIIVAKPGTLGDEPLATFHVDIVQGKTATISLGESTAKPAAKRTAQSPTPSASPKKSAPESPLNVSSPPASASSPQRSPAPSQAKTPPKRLALTTNLGQTAALALASEAVSGGLTLYFPVEFDADYAITKRLAVSGELLYRFERDGTYFKTNEVGFAVGPTLIFGGLQGFFATARIGLAYARGVDYNNEAYARLDLLLQPEVGVFVPLPFDAALKIGVGMQSLLLITDYPKNTWSSNALFALSHYYLPLLDLSVGFDL